jgi:SSS family solute:Na+ symporter
MLEVFKDSMTEGSFIYNFANMNFLKFSSFFFLYCVGIAVLVSMFTKADEGKDLNGLTISTVSDEDKAKNRASFSWIDIGASVFVISIVVWVMIYFS